MRPVVFAIHSAVICVALWGAPIAAWADTVTLRWDPSPDRSVTGYYVYVGTEPGVYSTRYDVGNTTGFVYGDGVAGQRYYFAVAAYFPDSVLSSLTNEVSWLPNNTPPTLVDPGAQEGSVGQPAVVQLTATDPDGQPLEYGATGYPPGVTLDRAAGTFAGTPTMAGSYWVTASVTDGIASASQTFAWTVAETAAPDVTPPVVEITMPDSGRLVTDVAYLTLGGTATARDDNPVVRVQWVNDRGGSGSATGTATWIAGIPLYPGRNDIHVTAIDAAGNAGTAEISIYRQ